MLAVVEQAAAGTYTPRNNCSWQMRKYWEWVSIPPVQYSPGKSRKKPHPDMIFFGPGFASPFQEALREARAPVHTCHILPVGGKAESRVLPCNCFRFFFILH